MHYAPEARLDIYAAAQRGLASLESNPNLQSKYSDYIDLYADLTEEELNEYRDHYLLFAIRCNTLLLNENNFIGSWLLKT